MQIINILLLPLFIFNSTEDTVFSVQTENLDSNKKEQVSTFFILKEENPELQRQDELWIQEQIDRIGLNTDTTRKNTWNYALDSIPFFEDSIYSQRLAELNKHTPFNLQYNKHVQEQINIYANNYRKHVSKMLGKAQYYFPLFEEILDRYNLPLEFKYLAVVESALKPKARSRSAATGLWQFMYGTGKIYDLKVTSYIDERSDPIKSTIAACEYFTFLYRMFDDWELVLAAYNGGPGYVSRAMRKTGSKDYWSVRPFLRKETQRYVPKFIAISYIMQYATAHNIYPTPYKYNHIMMDTVSVFQTISFETLKEVLGVNQDVLEELNPIYKKGLIPVGKNSSAILTLPFKMVSRFLNNEEAIYALSRVEQEPYIEENEPVFHLVQRGEYLGALAKKYNTTIKKIMEWNGLKKSNLQIGQKLIVYSSTNRANQETIEYIIRSGDTLWEIAKKHKGVSVIQIEELNKISSQDLKPGLKIQIPKA